MFDPLLTLIWGILIITLLVIFVYPRKGLLSRWNRAALNTKRVKIEDALKHLYNCEYEGYKCTYNSLAGNLSVNADEAASLLQRLEKMGLIITQGPDINLTDSGRDYALKIIRVHRLWETFLADETGVKETEWHDSAELKEHTISPEEADQLAAQIGNPLFDPHGDPIPSSHGIIPAKKGIPITQLKPGEFGRIIHIEDEPTTIYAQLVAEGIAVGQQVRIQEVNNQRIRFEADGELCALAPSFANNITIARLPDKTHISSEFSRLSDLKIGEKGIVVGISNVCRGQQRRRLLDLGLVPGTEVTAEIQSVGGDPTGYRIRGATIAIRKTHSEHIFIKGN